MLRFTSREAVFFELFVDTSKDIHKAAKMLQDLIENYSDLDQKIKNVKEMEHKCDEHVHKMLEHLNRSFVTPIDREDIFLIAKEMDNITDYMESTAYRFKMFNVQKIREDAKKFATLIVKSTEELVTVLGDLRNLKSSKIIREKIIEINRIENEGDDLFRSAVEKLFTSEADSMEVIRWKEIFELLENTLDACEDVANLIEGVVMKNA